MAFIQYVVQHVLFSHAFHDFYTISRASVSAERVNEVLDMISEIEDPKNLVLQI